MGLDEEEKGETRDENEEREEMSMWTPHKGHFYLKSGFTIPPHLPYFYAFITCFTNMRNQVSIFLTSFIEFKHNSPFFYIYSKPGSS